MHEFLEYVHHQDQNIYIVLNMQNLTMLNQYDESQQKTYLAAGKDSVNWRVFLNSGDVLSSFFTYSAGWKFTTSGTAKG